ncbi:MAG: alpha/beta fold hydrolase [Terracidiphilus sp.]|jgi:pimeloyl-ACP methyl ester carboxylesterase
MKWLGRVLLAVFVLAVLAVAGFFLCPIGYFNAAMFLKEDLGGIESRSVQVAGHRVHYLAEGPASGPVVVLVHGLAGRSEDWRNLAPQLAKAGFRVYMPDLVGYGRSDQPADFSYSVHDEAAIVVGFMDALGLKQVQLGGWSMGGWIVQLVAAGHPDRVKRLMLFDSAGLYFKPNWDTSLFTPNSAAQLDQLDALLMPHPPAVPSYVARDVLRVSRENGWIIQRALASMLTAQDVTDSLVPRLNMPVLIIWGSLDQITPLDQAQTMHRLVPHSELDVFDGCGHLAPLQCADRIGPKVIAFVQQ